MCETAVNKYGSKLPFFFYSVCAFILLFVYIAMCVCDSTTKLRKLHVWQTIPYDLHVDYFNFRIRLLKPVKKNKALHM